MPVGVLPSLVVGYVTLRVLTTTVIVDVPFGCALSQKSHLNDIPTLLSALVHTDPEADTSADVLADTVFVDQRSLSARRFREENFAKYVQSFLIRSAELATGRLSRNHLDDRFAHRLVFNL